MSATEKSRNLGIDILCCLGALMVLGVCFFGQIGLEEIAVTDYSAAVPIAVRWFSMSGAMLLAACTGFVLSGRKYSASYFKIFGRLFYIYIVGSLCAILIRCLLIGEEMTLLQIVQSLFGFSAAASSHVVGMYFLLLFAAPFLNAAFHGIGSRKARLTFLVITAAFSTLQPILQFGEITVIPEWCRGLAPIAAYLGGAYIRRHSKRKFSPLPLIFMIVLLAVQTMIVLFTSKSKGTLWCPWLDSMASLPSLCIALCLVSLFRSRQGGSGSAHRFFAGAAGGVLMGIIIAEPFLQCLMLNMVDSFPIPSMRLGAGMVVVPLVFIMCTALSLMLQIPIILIRQAGSAAQEDDEEDEEEKRPARPARRPRRAEAPVPPAATEEPEIILEDAEETVEQQEEELPEEEDADEEDLEETPAAEDDTDEEDELDEDEEEEEEESAEEDADDEEDQTAAEEENEEEYDEEDEDEYEDEEEDEADDEEDAADTAEPEKKPFVIPEAPTVSISLPRRTYEPLPQARENSPRHTITVPVSQPDTHLRLTQPPAEPPIGIREIRMPESRPAPQPEPPASRTRTYTLDEILTEQGIPVKHMPETVDDLIAELTK